MTTPKQPTRILESRNLEDIFLTTPRNTCIAAAALDISCEDVIRAPRQERGEERMYVREAGREERREWGSAREGCEAAALEDTENWVSRGACEVSLRCRSPLLVAVS